ncbi:MAG: peptidoglycan-binding protein, partial [Sphingorhabdus sp.]|nr:peptidoglycan-binding protein [Sphingorhabdus sp.]
MTDITITHDMLATLARRCSYAVPTDGLVFFGFRGLLPLDIGGTPFAASHRARLVSFDHQHMRCTLGQWRPADGKLALFPGSTVPNRNAMAQARVNNGRGANMLMLGRYAYDKGVHKAGTPTGHRAFRQGIFFPVWRNSDDMDFDLRDRLDTSGITPDVYPYDNLHCAHHDNVDIPGYSSNGCQVVSGRPMMQRTGNKPETGPWARFINNAYGADANGQTRFTYLLFSGAEAGVYAANPQGPFKRSLRFGSQGEWVRAVQQALQGHGFPFLGIDDDFGRDTLEAVMAFQNSEFGAGQADGVVGPNTAGALGIDWPEVKAQNLAPAALQTTVPSAWKSAALEITAKFENEGDAYAGVSGDFDGMGISCGVLQWNIGSNSLQPMVKAIGKPAVKAAMPTLGDKMWEACQANVADGLAIVRTWQSGSKLNATAKAELAALMLSQAMRAQQDERIDKVAATALQAANDWAKSAGRSGASKHEFLWFFDLTTQNGGLKGLTINDVKTFVSQNGATGSVNVICDFLKGQSGTSGHVADAKKNADLWRGAATGLKRELLILAYLRSGKSVPTWRHVVLNRKGSIAMGGGWVNSQQFDFSG